MKRLILTLVASLLCLVSVVPHASAQPGPANPVPAPAPVADKQIGITPERLVEVLKNAKHAAKIAKHAANNAEPTIVLAHMTHDINGTKWQFDVEFEFFNHMIIVSCPLQDGNKLTATDFIALSKLSYDMPMGLRYSLRVSDNKLVLESALLKAPTQISELDLFFQVGMAFGSAAKSYPHWSGQKAPAAQNVPPLPPLPPGIAPAPAAPQNAPAPAPAPKAGNLTNTVWLGTHDFQGQGKVSIIFAEKGTVIVNDGDGNQEGYYKIQNGTVSMDLGRLKYVGRIEGTKIIGTGSFENTTWNFVVNMKA